MYALGTHLLVELRECNSKILNDIKRIEEILVSAAEEAKATVLHTHFHKFSPHGISGVVMIAESHLSIHTWPEHGYAAADIFTCGNTLEPDVAAHTLIEKLQSKQPSIVEIKRGISTNTGRIELHSKTVKSRVAVNGRTKELQMVP